MLLHRENIYVYVIKEHTNGYIKNNGKENEQEKPS